jgi:nucleoid-associated protein YgaU
LAPTVIQQDKLSEKPNVAPVVYRTRQNEDLWSIAEKVYGSGRYFRALHECNVDRLNGLDNLPEGLELICPPLEELVVLHRAAIPDDLLRITSGQDKIAAGRPSVAQTKYTVRAQDSLFSIARDQLGQASRYLEIIELNAPLLNPRITHLDPLEPGMELKLPARKK